MDISDRIERYQAAASRAAAWLIDRQEADGSRRQGPDQVRSDFRHLLNIGKARRETAGPFLFGPIALRAA